MVIMPRGVCCARVGSDGWAGEANNPEWKTVALNSTGELVAPNGSIGFRWGEKGKWNLEPAAAGVETELSLSLLGQHDDVAGVGFPYFGGERKPTFPWRGRNRCWFVSYR